MSEGQNSFIPEAAGKSIQIFRYRLLSDLILSYQGGAQHTRNEPTIARIRAPPTVAGASRYRSASLIARDTIGAIILYPSAFG